jgi:hypothetical protein
MTSSIKATLLLACLAIVAATSLRAADEPKDVALAFAKAMQAGDSKAIHDISVGTPEQLKTIDALAEMMKAIGKFKTACDAKFGADNVLSKSMGQVPDLAAEVTKSEFKVDGDSVTVIDKTNPDDKHPLKLKKADGKWKIDLASMGDDATKGAPPGVTKVFMEVADEIAASKYKTVEEAAAAIGAKMQAANK